jgi:hypothetical protein
MLEWVPAAICFFFGHSYYFPFETPRKLCCRRCTVEYPRYTSQYRKARKAWFGGDV